MAVEEIMICRWSVPQICVLGFLICFFRSNGAFTIKNETGLEEIRNIVNDLALQVQALNNTVQKEKKKNVMFYAIIRGKAYTYNVHANVVFETVLVNEGGHYDRYDGVFVAPVSGTYLFSWTVSGSGAPYIVTELMIESQVISSAGEYNGGGGHPSGSMTALSKMNAGDHAWIRSSSISSGHYLYSHVNYPQSGFLGMLIVPD